MLVRRATSRGLRDGRIGAVCDGGCRTCASFSGGAGNVCPSQQLTYRVKLEPVTLYSCDNIRIIISPYAQVMNKIKKDGGSVLVATNVVSFYFFC